MRVTPKPLERRAFQQRPTAMAVNEFGSNRLKRVVASNGPTAQRRSAL